MPLFSNMWGRYHFDPTIGRVVYSETGQDYCADCHGEVEMRSHIPSCWAPHPDRIIYNGPATIVFWDDGTKTVVKRAKKDKDNKYNAFCAALAIKLYGSNSAVCRYVNSGITEKE